ncbi:tRNA lysidine(34) synthetase TilS [Candidatus Tremblaya phenacola]|nr:tRNA lysidine(34) synthetase TilS [Candidatus Tremblaya phenacola]
MNILINNMLEKAFNNMFGYKKIVLAYSGGLDSTVLLDMFTIMTSKKNSLLSNEYILNIRAIHVNHGLSCNSKLWFKHCRAQCLKRNIPFKSICLCLNKYYKGIENTAREERYGKLINSLLPGEVLVAAHHNDEQIESFFINLKRGSGPLGLSSMANSSYFKSSFLLRSLLQLSKYQLKAYANIFSLSWIEDESNNDVKFERSYLRIHILPTLKARWLKFNGSVSRSISIFFEQDYLINELLSSALLRLVNYDGSLSLLPLFSMDIIKRYAIIRRWLIKYNSKMPSKKKVVYIWKYIINCRYDAKPRLIHGNKFICRFHNKLYFIVKNSFSSFEVNITWNSFEGPLFLPKELGILVCYSLKLGINLNRSKRLSYAVKRLVVSNISYIETPSFNESMAIRFGNFNRKLLNYDSSLKSLCQLGIPFWVRNKMPLLFFENGYIASIGVYTFKTNKSNRCQVYWYIKR